MFWISHLFLVVPLDFQHSFINNTKYKYYYYFRFLHLCMCKTQN